MSDFFKVARQEMMWAGRPLVLETGKIARQADGAVVASYGNSSVLCTVVGNKEMNPNLDFFPLSVHYQEKGFAAGKIPGGFTKREGKPSESEVLGSRLIDRPLRPLFPQEFSNEVQIICTVLSYDQENDCQLLALIGASAALSLSGIPFNGPVAAANVGVMDGNFVLNPTNKSDLSLVVAGTSDGILMVESEANELSEELMLDAILFGHTSFQPVLALIDALQKDAGKPRWNLESPQQITIPGIKKLEKELAKAYGISQKQDRLTEINRLRGQVLDSVEVLEKPLVARAFKKLESSLVRSKILEKNIRVDGRAQIH